MNAPRRVVISWTSLMLMTVCFAATAIAGDEPGIRRAGDTFTLTSERFERTLVFREGKLLCTRFLDRATGRQLAGEGGAEDFSIGIGSPAQAVGGASGGWKLEKADIGRLRQGEWRLDIVLSRQPLRITRSYIVFPGSSIVREGTTIENASAEPMVVSEPTFLDATVRVSGGSETDFLWMTGAHNLPGSWVLKTEKLPEGGPRAFDSYDPYPHVPNSPRGFKPGSASYAPSYALYGHDSAQGLFVGFDYFGHWASRFARQPDGATRIQLRLAGFRRTLKPGERITMPWAFTGLYRDDLDNAGNELLDWQYAYLWDYTRDGRNGGYAWFPALRTLGYWAKGTGWGRPGVGWTGGNPDMESLVRKVFRVADYMRYTGTDVYHRDWGWWDVAGDWNGPDFRTTGQYLRKSEMGQLIYAFLYTVSRRSRVAMAHPDWLVRGDDDGMTLDLSRPEVVKFILDQLDSFFLRWGDFTWRNDSTITGERASDPSTLLEQDQNFRAILQVFLDKFPTCAFQAVNGGGNFAGYEYVRFASNVQFSDGVIGPLRNYYSSLLFPPDKNCDNPDQWDPNKYDKAAWRGLLCFNYDTTGDTIDPAKLEGIRELNDIYHYLLAQGVVGRWVRVYRPVVTGDEATMWFQRLSRDGKRGIIIPKHAPAGPVTVRPKGLSAAGRYTVTFHESDRLEERSGAELMSAGIRIEKMAPGELIYLNLPLHPGSKRDTTPPRPPTPGEAKVAENMGYPGVELTWGAGADDHWVSHYEIYRDGKVIDKVAKGRFYFDHSAGADAHRTYALRTVDGSGNRSEAASFAHQPGAAAVVLDDASGDIRWTGNWTIVTEPAAHAGTLRRSAAKGAAAEFVVEGKRAMVFSRHGADCGKLAVRVDDGEARIVDTFSADDIWGVCVWRQEFERAGVHRVRLEVVGEHHPRSTGNVVYIDGVRVEKE